MKAQSPLDQRIYYFVDKCMPFGASISCANFQRVSNAISHIVTYRTGNANVNYLDDFFFAALLKLLCNNEVKAFLQVCSEIGFPVSLEKTVWASTCMTFLGLLIDTQRRLILIPLEKITHALGTAQSCKIQKTFEADTTAAALWHTKFFMQGGSTGESFYQETICCRDWNPEAITSPAGDN